ncbi:hypothetical protein BKA66DRAFT_576154 [Pyrenochaeta sp. MPI-SDFR-AT-0127]|nr:hypothetical protein BKA66DRAFT_576154 [Pyrenochaeta sp. MPI-SDFR-AT-0127]
MSEPPIDTTSFIRWPRPGFPVHQAPNDPIFGLVINLQATALHLADLLEQFIRHLRQTPADVQHIRALIEMEAAQNAYGQPREEPADAYGFEGLPMRDEGEIRFLKSFYASIVVLRRETKIMEGLSGQLHDKISKIKAPEWARYMLQGLSNETNN